MTIKYNLVSLGDEENLTAFIDGEMYIASQDHKDWDRIVAGVRAQDVTVARLFDPEVAINEKFHRLTDRVSVKGGRVYFDNEPAEDILAEQIVRLYDDEADFMPLVNFMEKVANNPQQDSREHLFTFLRANGDFTITPDGDFLAYKGLHRSEKDGYSYKSGHSGHAIVDGEEQDGQIYQNVGSVVEMPRSEVTHDPNRSCSSGLHVGSHSYALGYGTVLVRVVVNPRDVVSVPRGEGEKMRVCRYVVIEENGSKVETPVYSVQMEQDDEYDIPGDDADDDFCDLCGDDNCEDEECVDSCDRCGRTYCDDGEFCY